MQGQIPFLDLRRLHAGLKDELDEVFGEIVDSAQFVGGPIVDRFEAEWAAYCGTKYAVGVSDGTSAIELTLRGLGIGPGDEVIVPAMTFIATWEAVIAAGARPVPVDVDPLTLLLTADAVAAAHTSRTAAVIVVHLYGQPANMDAMRDVAAQLGIALIEDAAQAHGAEWNGKRVGGLGQVGCFSFYPGKNLGALGDAGAVVTNDPHLANAVRSLSNHGRGANAHRHDSVGGTRRLDAIQAGFLLVKRRHLDGWNAARRRIADQYRKGLRHLPVRTIREMPDARSVYHLMVIELDHRDAVRTDLEQQGISTGVHYPTPCHRQKAFSEFANAHFPVTEKAARRVLSLPMDPLLCAADVERVIACVGEAIQRTAWSRLVPSPILVPAIDGDGDLITKVHH